MRLEASKRGKGAFSVQVHDDGRTYAQGLFFPTARDAYDYFRPSADINPAAWNVCYHLEDILAPSGA
jgi:hypothetical protein